MALVPGLDAEPRTLEDLRVEVAAVVDDDHDGRASREDTADVGKYLGGSVDVGGDGCDARPCRRRTDLELAAIVQAEKLVGVAMLLVVVDEPGVRR